MSAPTGLHDLVDQNAHMRRVYETAGAPLSRRRADGFQTLLRIIVDQQVSVQAGAAIWRKLEKQLGEISPGSVLRASAEDLRAGGLSRAKATYSQALAEEIEEGRLDLLALREASDAAVFEALTQVKGIGRWTAEIYLMFGLDRPDVFPVGDLALIVSAQRLLNLPERPSHKEMEVIAEDWRPWRTTAALMLWHYYRYTGGPGGPAGG